MIRRSAKIIDRENPALLKKAVKNPVELRNLRRAHVLDGLAVTRTIRHVKENLGKIPLTECGVGELADRFRRELGCLYPSFDTICGYGEHGAIMHYSAAPETDAEIRPGSFLLLDSGGQYYEGTTDITRTIACGEIPAEMKKHFALVLTALFNLSEARFLHGCSGLNLDVLARQPLWQAGLDYKHGTGHGVGYLSTVHEGPNSFRWRQTPGRNEATILEEGMVTSDEPGLYFEGRYGIRLENEVACRKGEQNEYGQFMYFETLTLAPLDLDALNPADLNEETRARLNAYHERVYQSLSPLMEEEERAWLRHYTRRV